MRSLDALVPKGPLPYNGHIRLTKSWTPWTHNAGKVLFRPMLLVDYFLYRNKSSDRLFVTILPRVYPRNELSHST